jgi:hypothetical protein
MIQINLHPLYGIDATTVKEVWKKNYSRLPLKIIGFEYCAFLGQFVAVIKVVRPSPQQTLTRPCPTPKDT